MYVHIQRVEHGTAAIASTGIQALPAARATLGVRASRIRLRGVGGGDGGSECPKRESEVPCPDTAHYSTTQRWHVSLRRSVQGWWNSPPPILKSLPGLHFRHHCCHEVLRLFGHSPAYVHVIALLDQFRFRATLFRCWPRMQQQATHPLPIVGARGFFLATAAALLDAARFSSFAFFFFSATSRCAQEGDTRVAVKVAWTVGRETSALTKNPHIVQFVVRGRPHLCEHVESFEEPAKGHLQQGAVHAHVHTRSHRVDPC